MKRFLIRDIILRTVTVLLFIIILQVPVRAQKDKDEKEEAVVSVSVKDGNALKSIKRIVIFMSGAEAPFIKVLQDAIVIELRNMGWDAVSRVEVETAVIRDLETLQSLVPDSIKADPSKFTQWIVSLPKAKQEEISRTGDEQTVAKLVNADAYLTGNIVVGRHQYTKNNDHATVTAEKIVITTASFQLVGTSERKPIFEAVMGYIYGKSAPYIAKDTRQTIEQHR